MLRHPRRAADDRTALTDEPAPGATGSSAGLPERTAPVPEPSPVALLVAFDLVTRRRLRLVDVTDSRLGPLAGGYALGAAGWTGSTATFVGFYEPPATGAAEDLQQRLQQAWSWAEERLQVQGAERAAVLLVALGPIAGGLTTVPPSDGPVRAGAAAVDPVNGGVTFLTGQVPGLPSQADLRGAVATVIRGGAVPTLAAVDLAERQTVADGTVAPVRRALAQPSQATIGLIAACVAVYGLEILALNHFQSPLAGLRYTSMYMAVGAEPSSDFLQPLGGPGDWWRVVSAGLVHAAPSGGGLGLLHILSNCFALWVLGRPIEQLYGRLALIGTFLLAVIGGNLAFLLVHTGSAQVGFGASGGVFGLIGLIAMLGRIQRTDLPTGVAGALRQWAITMGGFNLLFGLTVGQSVGINNSAHIGGLITGVLVGAVLSTRTEVGGRDRPRWQQAVLVGVIGAAATALVFAGIHLGDQLTQPFAPGQVG